MLGGGDVIDRHLQKQWCCLFRGIAERRCLLGDGAGGSCANGSLWWASSSVLAFVI